MRHKLFAMLGGLPLLLAAGVAAAPKPAPRRAAAPVMVRTVEGITEYRLANGLTVLLFPDPSKPTVTVNITYMVGSRHEGYGETGMAHLLEHLLFKGTPKHPDIPGLLKKLGANFNASTGWDRTNYFETVGASDENLRAVLALEADRMVNSFVAQKDLTSEMTVVRNEFESGENDPSGILMERVLSTAFLWHNYGNTIIGARSDIEGVKIENLRAFYRRHYRPDNAVLLIAGKFDGPRALAHAAQLFGAIKKPATPLAPTYTSEPVQDGERTVTLRRVGDVRALGALYHAPAGFHPDNAAVNVLTEALGATPGGRLHAALVEKKLATQTYGWCMDGTEAGFVYFGAQLRKDDDPAPARAALLKVLDDAAANPPTAEEVARAKAALTKQYELALQNSSRIGFMISEYIAMGDWRLFFLQRDRIAAVSPEDVARVARAYLKPSNRTLGEFIPEAQPDRAAIPAAAPVETQLDGFTGRAALQQGETFEPTPDNLEARIARKTLPGGLRTALFVKKTRGASVNLTLRLRFGDEKSLQRRALAGELAAQMLERGTTKHTRQQLKDEFDRLQVTVSVDGGASGVTVSLEGRRETLAPALRLVAEMLREPAFPAAEFESLRAESLAATEEMRGEPQALAGNALDRALNRWPAGDPRRVETLDEQVAGLKAATLDEVRAFHRDFYGADHGMLGVAGDFDADALLKLAGDLFGGWRSPAPYARLADPFQAPVVGEQLIETPDKANAIFLSAIALRLRDDDADYPALIMANYLLGGGSLSSRIADRLRQKEGFSYGAGSSLGASAWDDSGAYTAYAIYAPQNRAKLHAAYTEELVRARKDGFTQAELDAGRAGWLKLRQTRRGQDAGLADRLAGDLPEERTFAFDKALEARVGALTLDEVNAALRKWLDPAAAVSIFAGDFAGAAKPQ